MKNETKTKFLFVISFDGLATLDFEYISKLPNFKEFIEKASYCKKVYSVYPTLTYPAHATIVTGKYPKNHGIINNTLLQLNRKKPDWYWKRQYLKGETLYDLAIEKGMKVAAILWPVTAKSKIQYNMPEVLANRPWQNQIIVSMLNGTPLYQYRLNKNFGHLRSGVRQPNLDNFAHEAFLDTIKSKRPNLSLVHYTDLDTTRHIHGFHSQNVVEALERHDRRLGEIINTLKENGIYEESTIVLLGDHSSLDEDKVVNLNVLLREKGYISINNKGNIADYKAIVKNCDGSAYIYLKDKENVKLKEEIYNLLKEFNEDFNCIEFIYNSEEAANFGADPKCTFMLEANKGYYFLDEFEGEVIREVKDQDIGVVPDFTRSTHGYSPFKENYTTVFMAAGKGVRKGAVIEEMNLIDEGPTLGKLLGIELKEADGKVIWEFIE